MLTRLTRMGLSFPGYMADDPPADPPPGNPPPADPPPADPPPADPPPGNPPADPPPGNPPPAEITTEFTMPDGVSLDADMATELVAMAKEKGWSQEDAQGIATLGAKMMQKQQAALAEMANKWTADAKADKEIGGEKFEENLGTANKALDAFATREFVEFLKSTGLSNHPEMIRTFVKVGQAIGEDRLVSGRPHTSGANQTADRKMFPDMKPS